MINMVTLSKNELINFLGINEIRHAKDPSVKRQKLIMLVVIIGLLGVLAGYMIGQALMLDMLGQKDYIPFLAVAMASISGLVVGIYRAKNVIYREKDIDRLSTYPVSGVSIAVSRLFRIYFENLIIAIFVVIPMMIIYGIKAECGVAYYISIILVCIIVPILPTALAAWVGIIFAAIIARNRHKVLTEVILCLVIVFGTFAMSALISAKAGVGTGIGPNNKEINDKINAELARILSERIDSVEAAFPPLRLMAEALRSAGFLMEAVWAVISCALIAVTALVIGHNFFTISGKLINTETHVEYKLEEMKKNSVMTALIRKEAKRYFSSGIYVSNTIIGLVMAVAFAISLAFYAPEDILKRAGELPVQLNADALVPYIIGMLFSMVTIASSSVSIEGKNWWILRTLPLGNKEILGAKLLFNLIFAAPFYVAAEIAMLFTVNASLLERLWLMLIPALGVVFSILFGLFLNLRFPKMNWENEVEVVKQGPAVGLGIVSGIIILMFGVGAMIIKGAGFHLVNLGFTVVISVICLMLYRSIMNTKLENIA